MTRADQIALLALLYDLGPPSPPAERWLNDLIDGPITPIDPLLQRAQRLALGNAGDRGVGALRSIFASVTPGSPSRPYLPSVEQCEHPLFPVAEPALGGQAELIAQFWRVVPSCHTISAVMLALDRFASTLPAPGFGGDVSMADAALARAALAVCLNEADPEPFVLVAGDLSGVQSFLYTTSSKGALKLLRARSFYLDLLLEHTVSEILDGLALPRCQALYTGGGRFNLLLPNGPETHAVLDDVQASMNTTLFDQHQGRLFLALDRITFAESALLEGGIGDLWGSIAGRLSHVKARRWADQLPDLLTPRAWQRQRCPVCGDDVWDCEVCHQRLERVESWSSDPDDHVHVCHFCRELHRWGDRLPQARTVEAGSAGVEVGTQRYRLSTRSDPDPPTGTRVFWLNPNTDADLARFRTSADVPHFVSMHATFALQGADHTFKDFQGYAADAPGIDRIGALRMDVDHLGQLFVRGLTGERQTLTHLSALSRSITRFFKRDLDGVLAGRVGDMSGDGSPVPHFTLQRATDPVPGQSGRDAAVVYAGGDDLFLVGGWSDVMEAAVDIHRAFSAYAGFHPNVTISGGATVQSADYPLYHLALEAGRGEDAAKENGRDSFSLFYASALAGGSTGAAAPEPAGLTFRQLLEQHRRDRGRLHGDAMTWKWADIDAWPRAMAPEPAADAAVITRLAEAMLRDWAQPADGGLRWRVSHRFLYTLLHIEEESRRQKKLALPRLAYLLARQDASDNGAAPPDHWDQWRSRLLDLEVHRRLRPVLLWLLYLSRRKETS